MSQPQQVTSQKKTDPFIVKLATSVISAVGVMIPGLLLVTLNFSEVSATLVASVKVALPSPFPAKQLARDRHTGFNNTVAEDLDDELGS